MAVRIRMKKMGRTHRPYYRICAFDGHAPRDGRAIEELGTYDTSLADTDARAILKTDRIDYWLSVGAQPSDKVAVLIKKYGSSGTHTEQQKTALEKLAAPRSVPNPGAIAAPPEPEEPVAEEAVTDAGVTDAGVTDAGVTDAGVTDAGDAAEAAPTAATPAAAESADAGSTEAGSAEIGSVSDGEEKSPPAAE